MRVATGSLTEKEEDLKSVTRSSLTRAKPVWSRGFTLLEALVTLMVLSIGFLGTAGLMVRVTVIQARNAQLSESRGLTKAKIGQIAHVEYSLLGTGSDAAEQSLWGAPNEAIVLEGPLNAKGETDDGGNTGPFRYTRSFVVCLDNDNGGSSAASGNGDPCGDIGSTRPDELLCDVTETEEDQAIVRVLTTYRDRHGRCYKVGMQLALVSYQVGP